MLKYENLSCKIINGIAIAADKKILKNADWIRVITLTIFRFATFEGLIIRIIKLNPTNAIIAVSIEKIDEVLYDWKIDFSL